MSTSNVRDPEPGDVLLFYYPQYPNLKKKAGIVSSEVRADSSFDVTMLSSAYVKEGGTHNVVAHLKDRGKGWDFKSGSVADEE